MVRQWQFALAVAATALYLGCAFPIAASETGTSVTDPVKIDWNVAIPMRDDVKLSATIYQPAHQVGRLPVIVTITPYISDRYHTEGIYFARHGYVFAVVDCRGRGNSEGAFTPFVGDGRDGYDTIQWLASQSYADGQVGMWGGSYGGMNQWAVAATAPPALRTIVPASASAAGFDFPQFKNIFAPYMDRWLAFVSGRTPNNNWYNDRAWWNSVYAAWLKSGQPLRTIDTLAGNPNELLQTWLAHPEVDGYWASLNPSPQQYAQIRIPTLTIIGAYDADQAGALEHYRRHAEAAGAAVATNDYLLIGPWDHAGTRTPSRSVGGLDLGTPSVLDLSALNVAWYDWIMKGGHRPDILTQRVNWYIAGKETWTSAPSLEQVSDRTTDFYLSSPAAPANALSRAGSLVTAAPPRQTADHYVYDPLSLARVEQELKTDTQNYLTDTTFISLINGDGLIYDSAPLKDAITLSGRPSLKLTLSMDVPDTDIGATLWEILPDGGSVQLGMDVVRARYRHSLSNAALMPLGKPDTFLLDQFPWISRRLPVGSRLRLVIEPLGSSLQWEHNYNSGKPLAQETKADAKVATVQVHLGGNLSQLRLPLQAAP